MTTPPSDPPAPCPSCGSTTSAPIVYGLMDFETWRQNPGIVPGGCCVQPEDRKCRDCGTAFRSDGQLGDSWDNPAATFLLGRP